MTQEEKARAYDGAYKVAESIHRFSRVTAEIKRMEEIFPALKESEDERIRKVLIDWINLEPSTSFNDNFDGFSKEQILAWLEKQGEQKVANKVEPKFHAGDHVVDNCGYVWRIEGVTNRFYILESIDGCESRPTIEWVNKSYHLWTISDAKDGDILAVTMYPEGTWIGIFKEQNGCTFSSHCFVNTEGTFKLGTHSHGNGRAIHPATKEQRDLLFQKMREDEHEWDEIKKELKKIEQKSATMSLDEAIEHCKEKSCGNNACALEHKQLEKWPTELKELKEQKPAWSEDEEDAIGQAIVALEDMFDEDHPQNCYAGYKLPFIDAAERLKSLKERYVWKPSDEQIEAFEHFVRSWGESGVSSPYDNYTKLIYSLLQDLKKLKE